VLFLVAVSECHGTCTHSAAIPTFLGFTPFDLGLGRHRLADDVDPRLKRLLAVALRRALLVFACMTCLPCAANSSTRTTSRSGLDRCLRRHGRWKPAPTCRPDCPAKTQRLQALRSRIHPHSTLKYLPQMADENAAIPLLWQFGQGDGGCSSAASRPKDTANRAAPAGSGTRFVRLRIPHHPHGQMARSFTGPTFWSAQTAANGPSTIDTLLRRLEIETPLTRRSPPDQPARGSGSMADREVAAKSPFRSGEELERRCTLIMSGSTTSNSRQSALGSKAPLQAPWKGLHKLRPEGCSRNSHITSRE